MIVINSKEEYLVYRKTFKKWYSEISSKLREAKKMVANGFRSQFDVADIQRKILSMKKEATEKLQELAEVREQGRNHARGNSLPKVSNG